MDDPIGWLNKMKGLILYYTEEKCINVEESFWILLPPTGKAYLPSWYALHIHVSLSLSLFIRVCYNHNAEQFARYKPTHLSPSTHFTPFTVFGLDLRRCFCFIQTTQWVPTKTTTTCSSWSSSETPASASPTSCPDSPETSSAWRPNPPSASNSPLEVSPLIASSSRHKSGTLQAKKGYIFFFHQSLSFEICMCDCVIFLLDVTFLLWSWWSWGHWSRYRWSIYLFILIEKC